MSSRNVAPPAAASLFVLICKDAWTNYPGACYDTKSGLHFKVGPGRTAAAVFSEGCCMVRETTAGHKILVFSIVAACLIFGYLLLGTIRTSPEKNDLRVMSDGWYTEEGNVKTDVSLPGTLACPDGSAELRTDGLPENSTGQILTTRAAKYAIEVYVGERLLYRYNDHGQKRNDTVLSNEICFIPLPDKMEGRSLRIVYHAEPGQTEIAVPEIRVGTWNATLLNICRQGAYSLIITLTLLILGLLTVILSVVVRYRGGRQLRIINIGLFLLFYGFWCLTDSPLVQLLYSYNAQITYLNFYFFMLVPVPLLLYVRNTGEMRRYRAFDAFFGVYALNIAVQTALALTGKYTLFQMLWVTHCLIISATVLGLTLLIRENRRKPSAEIRTCLWLFTTAAALCAVSIVLYVFAEYGAYQALSQTGILLFVLILLSVVAGELVQNLRYRTEAEIYHQMAEEDKLTHLQNRRAFDLRMQGIELGTEHCANAALVFMDVNGLKRTNDCYGHDAGDRLVIAAARCAEEAFGGIGYCYRIGGDEFCAILPDPVFTEAELLERLQKQVERCNSDPASERPLSLACGCSFLRGADGSMQSVSDWKAEADGRMYADKKIAHEKMCVDGDPAAPRGEMPR